ncbi:M1 family metallopeptidase [Lacibacter sp.]|uniref:M1 family metallopeptidase n=1 Tax=Lacibacter sp. TaxID=1915409 RepID=UPI002B4B1F2B|nr:M1 family metallopeptidase [Lacibacter sp.]HLP35434.1 M1 family metallopeptidase [Lacibacter sp.]
MHIRFLLGCLLLAVVSVAQPPQSNPGSNHGNRFEQLGYLLQSPNEYRTASGAPGPKYWQQKADYDISVELDEANLRLTGTETITYFNNSPDQLTYLWMQLDENIHNPDHDYLRNGRNRMEANMSNTQLVNIEKWRTAQESGLGIKITKLTDASGNALKYTINQTMMRIDLPVALKPGQKFIFKIDWNYKIPDRLVWGSRGGYELFPEDGNAVFTMSQFYPRLAVYSDFQGWQNTQFSGGSEFALTFGNFKVKMTVPGDFVVAATGECQNYKQLLTAAQFQRWQQAQSAKDVVEVVTLAEATANEKDKSTDKKTWIYSAENVRDFAWGASRKFVWDAMPTYVEGKKIMSMSYYPKEAYALYRKYSTKVTAHTLKIYSKHTIPYPYPVAISVEASQGMEYPMIAFNYGRTEKDGTYSEATKYGMIGVVIHEVGHNFFPMIVNSDERQYWWMDEGLNTFTQFLTEGEFDNNYPSRRGPAHLITDYMKLPKDQLEPIMTMGDNVTQVGANAYAKAATGLNILRETVMGRELFDYSFREYARRWAFKHPTPADLFRTMEDASAVDLDWFWRGWYYGTEPVDISLDSVRWFKMNDASNTAAFQQKEFDAVHKLRNKDDKSITYATDADTSLRDYYYFNPGADAKFSQQQREAAITIDTENKSKWANKNFYELSFTNKGGMVMPVIVEWTFKDGSKEVDRVPVSVWKLNEQKFTKVFIKDKEVTAIRIDPMRETADIDESNNLWPVKEMPSKFNLFRLGGGPVRGASAGGNSMQRAQKKN